MRPHNLLQLSTDKCTTGCPILDRHLSGGIPCNSITEVVSESGCGKTQICLQLLLSAQLTTAQGGLSASSLYIHSEFPFPQRRLEQLSSHSHLSHNPLDNIFIRGVQSADEFVSLLDRIDALITNPPCPLPVRLIVIDSIAALFRSEFENNPADLKRRSSIFFRIAAKLKFYANKYNLAVLVTNQVVDLVGTDGVNALKIGNLGCLYTSGRRVCPALGLAWANCVNSRLFLSRTEDIVYKANGLDCDSNSYTRTKRIMHLLFAPHLPGWSCEFVIRREGVFGVNPGD